MNCNSIFKKQALIFTITLGIIFSSCSEDPVTSSNPNVTGKLLDFESHPVPNIEIKIGNQSVITSADGGFSFNNVTMPYDLAVLDHAAKSYYLYKGISTTNYEVPSYYGYTELSYKALIHVSIPKEIEQDLKGKIFFTDGNNINTVSDYRDGQFYVYLPERNKKYKGKLIVLIYKVNNDGIITSYDFYGESGEITIDWNVTYEYFYNFTMQQLSYNPEEKNVSVSFSHPPGLGSSDGYFYLTFSDKKIPYISEQLKMQQIGDIFNLVIPVNLPSEYDLILGKQTSGSGYTFENFIIDKSLPSATFDTKIPPAMISPADYEINVSGNTDFSFREGNGDGIYLMQFFNLSDFTRYFITGSSSSMNFSEIQRFGINVSNSDFLWWVLKSGPVKDMNEYMKYIGDRKNNFISSTEQRHFTTAKN